MIVVMVCSVPVGWAQDVEVSAGGGWAIPTNNVTAEATASTETLPIDLRPGPHAYVGIGVVRSIGERFSLGARLRAQASRLRSRVGACTDGACNNPEGALRAGTVEGRIVLTMSDWIQPYLLVGLGVVHVTVDVGTVDGTSYEQVSVTDAGGDIGIGGAFPVGGGFVFNTEFRVTGTLPGGRDNSVTTLPVTAGLSYRF